MATVTVLVSWLPAPSRLIAWPDGTVAVAACGAVPTPVLVSADGFGAFGGPGPTVGVYVDCALISSTLTL
ncbi:hypothetical protein AB0K00_57015 [Dactylosporangium sp. NPDC049525]|uniref:hypothetical protein n=1 Tax=Dactylosporangium sp. NPDC049525 TaxID=3154730 RepID=UPI0034235EFB